MMGGVYIDGVEIYGAYGLRLTKESYRSLLRYPALKSPPINEWAEEDGVEVDLSAPALDSREVELTFWVGRFGLIGDLLVQLSKRAYNEFKFMENGLELTLRLKSMPSLQQFRGAELFSLTFVDDFPLKDYSYQEPVAVGGLLRQGYLLGGRRLTDYGVLLTKGSDAQIAKSPEAKRALLVAVEGLQGAIYDSSEVCFGAKDVTLNCLIQAPSWCYFWHNYNALLYDLVRSGERELYSDRWSESYGCYYKSSQVSGLYSQSDGAVACQFSLTLVFTSYRVSEDEILLASELGEMIITESGEYAIDLK